MKLIDGERLPVQREIFYAGCGTGCHTSDKVLVIIGRGKRIVSLDFLRNGKWAIYGNDVVTRMPWLEP